MSCQTCRRKTEGDCHEFRNECNQYRPPRGQMHAWLCDTGETHEQYIARDNAVPRAAIRGSDVSLPAPYNKRIPGQKERDLQRAVLDVLTRVCGFSMRIEGAGKLIHGQNGAVFAPSTMKGMTDCIGCLNGRLVAVEVKKSGGSLSPEQNGILQQLMAAGAMACVCVDPSKLEAWLKGGASTATTRTGVPVV